MCQEMQVLIFYAFNKQYLNDLAIDQVNTFQETCLDHVQKNKPEFMTLMRERRKLDPEVEKMLDEIIRVLVTGIVERTLAKANRA